MGIKNHVEIVPLTCMSPAKGVDICPVDAAIANNTAIAESLVGHETNVVTIAPGTVEELFVHRYQTDQLLVVRGCVVLVILQNRQYRYIPLYDCQPTIVRIPPGIPHSAINLSNQPCIAINSVLRHAPADERDYRPLKPLIPYDLAQVQALMAEFHCPAPV